MELASQLPPDSLTGNELRIELNSGGGPMVGEGGRSQTVRAVLVR